MKKRSIVSLLLVLMMVMTSFTSAFGINGTLQHRETGALISPLDYLFNFELFNEVANDLSTYNIRVNDKFFSAEEVDSNMQQDPSLSIEDVVQELDEAEEVEEVEEVVGDLEVEVVSAINTSTLEATLEEAGATGFTVTFEDEAVEVVSATADEDELVYTVVVEDLDGKEGTLVVNGFEWEFDFSADALTAAIALVNAQAPAGAGFEDALKAPILNLVNINDDLIGDYGQEIDDTITVTTRAHIQAAIDRVNENVGETLQELVDDVNDAVSDYFAAVTTSGQDTALFALAEALDALDTAADTIGSADFDEGTGNDFVQFAGESSPGVGLDQFLTGLLGYSEATAGDLARDLAVRYAEAINAEDTDAFAALKAVVSETTEYVEAYYAAAEAVVDLFIEAELKYILDLNDDYDLLDLDLDPGFTTGNTDDAEDLVDEVAEGAERDQLETLIAEARYIEAAGEIVELFADDAAWDREIDDLVYRGGDEYDLLDLELDGGVTDLADLDNANDFIAEVSESHAGFAELETLVDHAEQLVLVTPVNDVLGEGNENNVEAALDNFDYAPFINLGGQGREEFSALFYAINKGEEFTNTADVEAAIDEAIEAYNDLLADINSATTIAEMRTALRAVATAYDGAVTIIGIGDDLHEFADATAIDNDNAEDVLNQLNDLKDDDELFMDLKEVNDAF